MRTPMTLVGTRSCRNKHFSFESERVLSVTIRVTGVCAIYCRANAHGMRVEFCSIFGIHWGYNRETDVMFNIAHFYVFVNSYRSIPLFGSGASVDIAAPTVVVVSDVSSDSIASDNVAVVTSSATSVAVIDDGVAVESTISADAVVSPLIAITLTLADPKINLCTICIRTLHSCHMLATSHYYTCRI